MQTNAQEMFERMQKCIDHKGEYNKAIFDGKSLFFIITRRKIVEVILLNSVD